MEWWDQLEMRFQEVNNRDEGERETVADEYQHGKRVTVNPGIGGHTKRRKRRKK
jgi:hypothetical protein